MMGRVPMLTSDFGTVSECSRNRVPRPPQNSTTFMRRVPVSTPEEVAVDLPGALQVLELLQAGESTKFVGLLVEFDALEQVVQLLDSLPRAPAAHEAGELGRDLVEGHTIAAVIRHRRAGRHLAADEHFGHLLRNLADTIVLGVAPDVEDLAVDRLRGRLERAADRRADVLDMHHRAPGTA